MPASLYARYVPPKKNNKPSEQSHSQPPLEQSSAKNELYARYVPPKKSKPLVTETPPSAAKTTETQEKASGSPTEDEGATDKSKKRKRKEIGTTSTGKSKKSKSKDNKHKTRSLEVAEDAENDEKVESSQEQEGVSQTQQLLFGDYGTDEGDGAVDVDEVDINSIFAKYSVTGRANRTHLSTDGQTLNVDKGPTGDAEDENYDPTAGAEAIFTKYKKALSLSQKRSKKEQAAENEKEKSPEPELHDLVPMPQPEKAPWVPYKAAFSSLPSWISNPRAVQSNATMPFEKLNLNTRLAENLSKKNFTTAMAVQTAVLPLLLPGRESYAGDICVSAPTGSGKTLSYVLPMVEGMQDRVMTRLRGLIVVPTRELVAQAREVAEMCVVGTGVKIGTAVGSLALAAEQAQLVKRGQKYDPEGRKALNEEAERRIKLGFDKDDDLLKDIVDLMPGHVPEYTSTIDILICTPGRLVDHIRSTPGFTVQFVEWLAIDEADRLLDSNFQDWVDIVLPALESVEDTNTKAKVLGNMREKVALKKIQKVILSATMTRDLSKLASLKLNRPTLVAVVEPEKNHEGQEDDDEDEQKQDGHAAILPATLKESAVPVSDGSEKPLYLLQLLKLHLEVNTQDSKAVASTILVFCASDDNATRLARLLALLSPPLEPRIAVLTKSTTTASRRKILNSFGKSGGIAIVISTDRTSRGLDVENLSFVVNYDIPPSVTSYVHRVGRTARAGKGGEAWTLITDTEARWFWRTIAKGNEINRGGRFVDRIRLGEAEDALKEGYQDALQRLGEAVRAR